MGDVLIFDKWANEGGVRVQAWLRPNGDVTLVFIDINKNPEGTAATLTSYRADDLQRALVRREDARIH